MSAAEEAPCSRRASTRGCLTPRAAGPHWRGPRDRALYLICICLSSSAQTAEIMPLRLTSAPTAGIKKRKAAARPRASPFAGHGRQKPGARPRAEKADAGGAGGDEEQLPDVGVSRYIPETAAVSDVVQAIQHIRATMFEDLPARAGMNSTRIAEVLNFRRALPPLVSVAHVHTLLNAPTKVEKEIVELVKAGRVRRLIVPGRGSDAAGLEDCLVLAEDWEQLVRSSSDLDQQLKGMPFLPLSLRPFLCLSFLGYWLYDH